MRLPLVFHPDVAAETDAGYRWYESERAGLGSEFLDELARVLGNIESNIQLYGFSENDVREGILRRFPHGVCHRVLKNRIRVLAVFRAARDQAVRLTRR